MVKKGNYNPQITKKINHYSRAINKIDPELKNKVSAVQYAIKDIKVGINDITYMKNGEMQRVRYDAITSLSRNEQASLLNKLTSDRYVLREERALQQLKEKGKISRQFKASIKEQNQKLYENIQELEDMFEGNKPENVQTEFGSMEIITGEEWFEEADSYFQDKEGTPGLFDFYRPGESGGFSELNSFTWNIYKQMKGMI